MNYRLWKTNENYESSCASCLEFHIHPGAQAAMWGGPETIPEVNKGKHEFLKMSPQVRGGPWGTQGGIFIA